MKQYQPLYLKYRPQSISELVGQEIVSKTLSNAITYNKIVHAYLFCGPRGTGKTSTARILAKSLNCEPGVTVNPCGKCNSCTSITNGNSLDVIEIDAASHRKVEDAEDLINRVNLGTYGSRYKIYIIDEVHMLTDHAFNALLKTLEEPPKNVIFILATTEDHKVIPTIISRCQKLDFKAVGENDLEQRVREISKKEKINMEEPVVKFITKKASGCLRDAVSLLDQISVLQEEDKVISSKDVFALFGTVDRIVIFNLIKSILLFENNECIKQAEDLIKSGKDPHELLKSIQELVLDLAKAKIDISYKKLIEEEFGCSLNFLETIDLNHILKILEKFQNAQGKLRYAISKEIQFLVDVVSLLDKDLLYSVKDLTERVNNLEQGIKSELKTKEKNTVDEIIQQSSVNMEELNNDKVNPDIVKNIPISEDPISDKVDTWKKIIDQVSSNPTKTLLKQSETFLIKLNHDLIEVGLSKDMFLPRLKSDTKKQELILKSAKLVTGIEPKDIKFVVVPDYKEKEVEVKSLDKEEDINLSVPEREEILEEEPPVINAVVEKKQISEQISDDEFSRAMKDLLGAKEID